MNKQPIQLIIGPCPSIAMAVVYYRSKTGVSATMLIVLDEIWQGSVVARNAHGFNFIQIGAWAVPGQTMRTSFVSCVVR